MSPAPSTRDIVGVPVLPPAGVVPAVERVRAALAGIDRLLTPPPVQVLDALFGALDHVALGALCALSIPDHLDRRIAIEELARRADADPDTVDRLVRYAGARGWLRLDRHGRVSPTSVTRFLRNDHPGGWRAWVEFATSPEVMAALGQLARDPRSTDAFAAANGAPFFDWQVQHPDRHEVFDAAMAAGARLHGLALADAIDWSDFTRVCDVGGGRGALLHVLLEREPHLHGVLFDLPAVVARAPAHERLSVVGGDAFTAIPDGCDVYLFVNVLHDWDDGDAARLLRNVPRGTKTIVVEAERRTRPIDGITARTDLLMLALAPGGRERSAEEFARLARSGGGVVDRSVRLVSGDRAIVISS